MNYFDVDPKKEGRLVLLVPQFLQLHHSKSPKEALAITRLAMRICRKRWPNAYIKIDHGDYGTYDEDSYNDFICLDYGAEVPCEDMADSASGPFIRDEVEQAIVRSAIAKYESIPSTQQARLSQFKESKAKKKRRDKKAKWRAKIAEKVKARLAESRTKS